MELYNLLKDGCSEMEIEIDNEKIDKLLKYKDLLLLWNEKMNLTAIEEEKEIIIKHFLDSLTCAKLPYIKGCEKLIDVGTGAGFPGIPLKVYFPELKLTLMDSLNKRINFLREVCKDTKLENVNFVHGRAEDFGQKSGFRENYDIAVARAVAPLNILAEYCIPFVKLGGYFICQKGPNLKQELKEADKAIKLLGGQVVENMQIKLPFSDITHSILIIKKVKETSTKYPRKAGKPSKNPVK